MLSSTKEKVIKADGVAATHLHRQALIMHNCSRQITEAQGIAISTESHGMGNDRDIFQLFSPYY